MHWRTYRNKCQCTNRQVLLLGHIFLWLQSHVMQSDICCCADFVSVCFRYVWKSIAESFYHVKYGLSIIRQKFRQKFSVMKTKIWCFQLNSLFWHFNSCFVLKATETPVFMFSLLRFFDIIIDDPYLTLLKDSAKV